MITKSLRAVATAIKPRSKTVCLKAIVQYDISNYRVMHLYFLIIVWPIDLTSTLMNLIICYFTDFGHLKILCDLEPLAFSQTRKKWMNAAMPIKPAFTMPRPIKEKEEIDLSPGTSSSNELLVDKLQAAEYVFWSEYLLARCHLEP